MKKKLLQACIFFTLLGLLLITPTVKVSADTQWNLQVTNLAGTTVNYSYDQLLAMPQTNVTASLSCYDNLISNGNWGGVSLTYLLQQAGLDPSVASIDFLASDGYAVNIPMQLAMQSVVIIAYEMNGAPLPEVLRLVVPGENGNMWIDKITSINMSTAIINIDQSAKTPAIPIQAPSNPIGQSSTQQQELIQQQASTQKNGTSIEPTASPANSSQPTQKASYPQGSNLAGLGLPLVVVYGIAFGATIGLVAVGYVVFSRKRAQRRN